jgi:hypothetical protein
LHVGSRNWGPGPTFHKGLILKDHLDLVDPITSTRNTEEVSERVQETLKKSQKKYKARHNQHRTERSFRVGDRVWLQLNKKRLQGLGNKIKALRYGSCEVLVKVGDNAYILSLPQYMHIYSIVNVDNLKLCEPSMLY